MPTPLEGLRLDGFHVARDLLPSAAISDVLASIERTVSDQLSHLGITVSGADLFGRLRALHAADIGRYTKTLGALWRKADIAGLMRHPALFAFVRDAFGWQDVFLPGGDVVLLMARELAIPGGYFGLAPHQDFPSVQGSLDGLVVWIPLTDADRAGYPIEVVAGSHRRGLITGVDHTRNGWEVRPDELAGADWRPVEVAMGDVVFMSVFTIHRSALDGAAGRMRIALSTRFDNAAEATFVERIYPTAYQRVVHREQFVRDFPTAEQIARLFEPR
jgi:hypothetical protein